MAKKLEFDLLANDRASRPVRNVGDAFDDTRRKLEKFNRAGDETTKGNARTEKSTKTLGDRFQSLAAKAGPAALSVGKFAAAGGAATSIAVPLAAALTHGAIAAAQFG